MDEKDVGQVVEGQGAGQGEVDNSKRNIMAALMGSLGVAALAGCAEGGSGQETAAALRQAYAGTNNPNFEWVTWIGTEASQDPNNPNLHNLFGSEGQVVVAGGFWTPGDGGGGIFIWITANPLPQPDGGTIIVTAYPYGYWKRIYSGPLDVRWFGAVGTTDDSGGINSAASAAANSKATLYFPSGKSFQIQSTVTLNCNVQGTGAMLLTAGSLNGSDCTAILIGTSLNNLCFVEMHLPDVKDTSKPSVGWGTSTRVGVECRNLTDCEIHLGCIWNFTIGAYITGTAPNGANQDNRYFLSSLINNKVQLWLRPLQALPNAWVNENTFYNGIFMFGSEEGSNISGARQIVVGEDGKDTNGNLFIKPDLEGDGPEYLVECWGSYNQWLHARWETINEVPRVQFSGSACRDNVILYGYAVDAIVLSAKPGFATTGSNNVISALCQKIQGGGTNGTVIASNNYSSAKPTFVVMPPVAGGWVGNADPAAAWSVSIGADQSAFKYTSDREPRILIDTTKSTLSFGLGAEYECASVVGLDGSTGFLTVYGIYGTRIGGAYPLGFYTATPVAQQARVGTLTDSTGGTAGTALDYVPPTYSQTQLQNALATLAAKVNALEHVVHSLGLTA